MVLHAGRDGPFRRAQGARGRQEQHLVVRDLGLQRGAILLPVGQQLGEGFRIDDGARQDMGTHLGPFLEHADVDLLVLLGRQLLEPDGGGQTGRSGADDHDIEFHRVAFDLDDGFISLHGGFL